MQSHAQMNERLDEIERIWLFLDYDGTLADFAPTPAQATPEPEVVGLLARLAQHPRLFVAIVSGRRLSHVQILAPVPGILLAGTYGIELQLPNGKRLDRIRYDRVRPTLDTLKPRWEDLIAGHDGFFLEDKGWALALHARFAADGEAERILATAGRMAAEAMENGPGEEFRVLGGHKFLEIGPRLAHKGRTVEYLLDRYPISDAVPVYLGDDDKDEEAFRVVQSRGGISILVAAEPRETRADYRLESPQATWRWLEELMARLDRGDSPPRP